MKTYKFDAWYRYTSHAELEKDFYQGEVEAESWEEAQEQIKQKDRRIFKIERVWS